MLRIAITLIPAGVAAALALISVADRPLEVWFLVLMRYWQRPRVYLWRSLRVQHEQQRHIKRKRDHTPIVRASLELRVGTEGKEQSVGKQSDTFIMPPKSRKGGVQSEFVRVRDIAHNVLCLASPHSKPDAA